MCVEIEAVRGHLRCPFGGIHGLKVFIVIQAFHRILIKPVILHIVTEGLQFVSLDANRRVNGSQPHFIK